MVSLHGSSIMLACLSPSPIRFFFFLKSGSVTELRAIVARWLARLAAGSMTILSFPTETYSTINMGCIFDPVCNEFHSVLGCSLYWVPDCIEFQSVTGLLGSSMY